MGCGRTTVGVAFAAGLLYSLQPTTASAQNAGQIDAVHSISNYAPVSQQTKVRSKLVGRLSDAG